MGRGWLCTEAAPIPPLPLLPYPSSPSPTPSALPPMPWEASATGARSPSAAPTGSDSLSSFLLLRAGFGGRDLPSSLSPSQSPGLAHNCPQEGLYLPGLQGLGTRARRWVPASGLWFLYWGLRSGVQEGGVGRREGRGHSPPCPPPGGEPEARANCLVRVPSFLQEPEAGPWRAFPRGRSWPRPPGED